MKTTLSSLFTRYPRRRISWARLVSDVISPPVVWGLLSIPVALKYAAGTGLAMMWAFIYSLFICLLPVAYVVMMVWLGKIGDLHMKHRKERYKPLLVTILGAALAWWLLRALAAPPVFPLLALMSLVQVAVIAAITLVWQISMHAMSVTAAVVAIGIMFHILLAALLVPVIVLVGSARLKLKRHTPAQVFAGTLVGGLVPIALLLALAT